MDEVGFLGRYILDKETVCHRTQVALRLLCLSVKKWQQFVDGLDDGEYDQSAVDTLLAEILESYLDDVEETITSLKMLDSGLSSQRVALRRRWRQIRLLLENTIERQRSGRDE